MKTVIAAAAVQHAFSSRHSSPTPADAALAVGPFTHHASPSVVAVRPPLRPAIQSCSCEYSVSAPTHFPTF
ncbi:hypothetical protein BCR44DRAFT_66435 [Catenaria anguillulae PL171]|uniref:Uncharacterized protein n=1 Tax=Catenaria anguillulae PL171 TaxID=765915 RepID=A0A1Y2HFU6_9FUNG|nr:hypothetical protein BCR44DRAFT_66435 [Catenaria anguillulae PL171]